MSPACFLAVFHLAVVPTLAAAWRVAGTHRVPVYARRRCVAMGGGTGDALETVQWLRPLDRVACDEDPPEDAMVLPVFPLDGSYLPFTKPVLNIFEPRYRKLYNDILFNGSRRFVVVMVDEGTKLARVGVVFYLDDLKGARSRGVAAAWPEGGSHARGAQRCLR